NRTASSLNSSVDRRRVLVIILSSDFIILLLLEVSVKSGEGHLLVNLVREQYVGIQATVGWSS
ncbi:MAG TPA: hypothetical protein VN666_21275, partial [Nitrospira sp.]|nr:hypothetical protein [Nitrospira sp.]